MTDLLSHLGATIDGDDLTLTTDERHTNVNGGVHGGLLATLLDSTMGEVVRAGLDEGQTAVTVQMNVTYLRPAKPGDDLRCRADVIRRGSELVMAEADVERQGDDGAETVAHAVATFSVIDEQGDE